MDAIQGTRTGSKNYTPARIEPPCLDSLAYEAQITNLFMPWLIEGVSDKNWLALQKKLGAIVRNIIREEHHQQKAAV